MTPVSGGPWRYAPGDPCARLFDGTIVSAGPSRVARLRLRCEDRRRLSSSRATSGGASAASRCHAELTPFAPLALRATLLLDVGGGVQARRGGCRAMPPRSSTPRDARAWCRAMPPRSSTPRDARAWCRARPPRSSTRRAARAGCCATPPRSSTPRSARAWCSAMRSWSSMPRGTRAHVARRTSVVLLDAAESSVATRAARAARHGPARTARRREISDTTRAARAARLLIGGVPHGLRGGTKRGVTR